LRVAWLRSVGTEVDVRRTVVEGVGSLLRAVRMGAAISGEALLIFGEAMLCRASDS